MGENSNNSMKYQLHGCTDNGNLVTQDTCPPLKASNVKNQSGVQAYHNRINHLSESGNPVTENNTNDEEGRTYNEDNVADRSRRAILSYTSPTVLTTMLCEKTLMFWTGIENDLSYSKEKSHVRCFDRFWQQMKKEFPKEEGLNSKCTINLMKHVLNVHKSGDILESVTLKDLNRAVNLFGPIRLQGESCVFVQQLCNTIVEYSKMRDTVSKYKTSWFVGYMSRCEAENALLQPNCKDKTFLIRISSSDGDEGDFVLSVKHEDHCHHLKIKSNPEKALMEYPYHARLEFAGQEFPSLPEVVNYIIRKQEIQIETEDDNFPQQCKAVICLRVFTKSPLNGVVCGYQKAKRWQ